MSWPKPPQTQKPLLVVLERPTSNQPRLGKPHIIRRRYRWQVVGWYLGEKCLQQAHAFAFAKNHYERMRGTLA